jgi:transcriptional regulator with GAF, ATPase, and Fis domain
MRHHSHAQGLSAEQLTEATRLYQAGQSVAEAAHTLGFQPTSVYDALKRAGVTMRPVH